MAQPPPIEDLAPLLGDTAALDEPAADDAEAGDGEYLAAAVSAVGTRAKAAALKDAILSCLREHGLLGDESPAEDTGSDDYAAEDETDDL